MTQTLWSLVWITALAAIVPLILGLLRWRIAAVVLLLAGGAALGPHGLHLITVDEPIALLSDLGLGMLFFLAGMEIEAKAVRGKPGRLAAAGWLISLALAAAIALALHLAHLVDDGLGFAIALTSTALGTLLPVLRDNGELSTRFGQYFLGAGAWGEFGPIIAIAVLLSTHAAWQSVLIVLGFLLFSAIIWFVGYRLATPRVRAILNIGNTTSSQTALRFTLLVVVLLLALASRVGLDLVLGAFIAGIIVKRLVADEAHSPLPQKVETVAYGFFIPIFFVVAGANLDVRGMMSNITLVLVLFVTLFLLRGLPQWLLYRRALPDVRERTRFSLYVATALPIIIALVTVEVADGVMRPANGTALIGAGALTVLVFPLLGDSLVRGRRRSEPSSVHDLAANTD